MGGSHSKMSEPVIRPPVVFALVGQKPHAILEMRLRAPQHITAVIELPFQCQIVSSRYKAAYCGSSDALWIA